MILLGNLKLSLAEYAKFFQNELWLYIYIYIEREREREREMGNFGFIFLLV